MNNSSESMKISPKTARRIRTLARKEQRTITAVIDRAVHAYEQAAKKEAS